MLITPFFFMLSIPKNHVSKTSRCQQVILVSQDIRQPKGNNKAGFPPRKIGNFGFQALIPVIRKYGIKSAPIRPGTPDWPKIEYARFEL
jgi:hypothetical protein